MKQTKHTHMWKPIFAVNHQMITIPHKLRSLEQPISVKRISTATATPKPPYTEYTNTENQEMIWHAFHSHWQCNVPFQRPLPIKTNHLVP